MGEGIFVTPAMLCSAVLRSTTCPDAVPSLHTCPTNVFYRPISRSFMRIPLASKNSVGAPRIQSMCIALESNKLLIPMEPIKSTVEGELLRETDMEAAESYEQNRATETLAPLEDRRLAAIAAAEARMDELEAAERAARKRKAENELFKT